MLYDIVIVGGGIAGLYSAYRLLQSKPDTKLLLIEKQADVGGRVFTYTDDTMTVEGGAGRFIKRHTLLWKLLKELGLASKAVPNMHGYAYIEDGVEREGYAKDVAEVVKASSSESVSYLRSVSFLDFAKRVVGPTRAQHIVDSFGYYSELVIMNAHDAIVLMDVLKNPDFYSLSGGLSQLIVELEKRIRGYANADIWTRTEVSRFVLAPRGGIRNTLSRGKTGGIRKTGAKTRRSDGSTREYRFVFSDGRSVSSTHCIFAVPKQALEKLSAFRPVRPLLRQIACGSLCRIYSQFAPNDSIQTLYDKKRTTNNDLRMIIPIDRKKGVVMISYSDNRYADAWHAFDKANVVDSTIAGLVRDTLAIDLPKPLKTKVFYWPCGVGYWKVGANSRDVSKRILRPFPGHNVYVCGEHYSEKYQQWMEGALETSQTVLDRFFL